MVAHTLTRDETDRLFHALADGTRRDIVERVIEREQSVSALAESYAVSFAAVQKHVAVLERAALVTKTRRGREQIVRSNIDSIRTAQDLLRAWELLWVARADRISAILAEPTVSMPARIPETTIEGK